MALPPADPKRHRRQQRRRALIGWLGGVAVVALSVVAGIAGSDEEGRGGSGSVPTHAGGIFDITAEQFERIHTGETEEAVLDELGKSGSPEGETPIEIISLFPTHGDSVFCSYWLVSDREEIAARLCFSRPGRILRQKLERDLAQVVEGESESSIRA